ncbi:tRNA epoxyqueuosine(34) reductase QueG [Actinomarinicola tropica]|uniref:tRNA epoxyqueuosine(34) reductase QueG n=1 Tax=Actinomarinicola tropica TaxID=2789776 RepID=UPI001898BF34|nr:tRNA epoxyqueuosine(34) reductase QueG [Actinomarinicola tropica]
MPQAPVAPPPHDLLDPEPVLDVGRRAGLSAVGVAPAEPFDATRRILEERRAAGLSSDMQFTYRNPARSTDPGRTLEGAAALVVGALAYRRPDPEPPAGTPAARVARYAWTDDYARLRAALEVVAEHLRAEGWRAVVVADQNALVDREAAHRAGIGWYGKSSNLLLPGAGSWFVLGSVVTDAPLRPAEAPVADGCGSCTRCIDACPTGAIVAPGVVDARRCLAWLVQSPGALPHDHREALGDRIYGCDDCQEVCPPNHRADRLDVRRAPGSGDEPWVDLLELLATDDATLLARHGRWYVPRRDPRYLRRNALVALGNVGDPADPRVAQAVEDAAHHDDPMVRAHAVWAARRLGLHHVVRAASADPAPEVRDELTVPVTPRSA